MDVKIIANQKVVGVDLTYFGRGCWPLWGINSTKSEVFRPKIHIFGAKGTENMDFLAHEGAKKHKKDENLCPKSTTKCKNLRYIF